MILDLFDLDCKKVQEFIFRIFSINIEEACIRFVIDLFIILILIVLLFKLCRLIRRYCIKDIAWRKKYFSDNIGMIFLDYLQQDHKKLINTRVQMEAPSIYEEPRMSIANAITEDMIKKFLDVIFEKKQKDSRLYCILADSGMGKTTALVNFFISYINKHKSSNLPFDIRILSLSEKDVIDKIKKMSNDVKPQNTILLLDALDENINAVIDYKAFLSELEESIKEYRFVVMTCRTQFFPTGEEQPKESKIVKDGKAKGYALYQTFYISPFNDLEIEKYVDQIFGKHRYLFVNESRKIRREKADRIIGNDRCRSLLVRPMILSHIEQLVDDGVNCQTTIDVYDAMVDFWLNREVSRIDSEKRDRVKNEIFKLSSELARDIYDMRVDRGGYYIDRNQFTSFLSSRGFDNTILQFRERSLLNRDASGLIKFSHKSFLEYFMAYNYFENENIIEDFKGIDFARCLYLELCERYFKKNANINGNSIEINPLKKHYGNISNLKHYKGVYFRNFEFDTIHVYSIGDFHIRYLDFIHAIVLVISKRVRLDLFCKSYSWMSNIFILEIYGNKFINIDIFSNFPNVKIVYICDMPNTIFMNKLYHKMKSKYPNVEFITDKYSINSAKAINDLSLYIRRDNIGEAKNSNFNA